MFSLFLSLVCWPYWNLNRKQQNGFVNKWKICWTAKNKKKTIILIHWPTRINNRLTTSCHLANPKFPKIDTFMNILVGINGPDFLSSSLHWLWRKSKLPIFTSTFCAKVRYNESNISLQNMDFAEFN